ncbi:MAG: cytochrome c, partial [Bacteroidota bacterium]
MFKTTSNLTKIFFSIALGLLSFTTIQAQEIPTDESIISAGESTFKANCTQCHQIWEVRIGPALNAVYERRSVEWLNSWIKNSQAMIAAGDEQAVALWEEYNKTAMPAYPFSDDQIMELLAYIQAETVNGPPVAEVAVTTGGTDEGDSVSSSYLMAIIIILIVVLLIAVIALILAARTLVKYLKDAKGLDEAEQDVVSQEFNVLAFLKSNSVVGLVIFVFTIVVLKTLIDGAFT